MWQGSHRSTNVPVTGMVQLGKVRIQPCVSYSSVRHLITRPPRPWETMSHLSCLGHLHTTPHLSRFGHLPNCWRFLSYFCLCTPYFDHTSHCLTLILSWLVACQITPHRWKKRAHMKPYHTWSVSHYFVMLLYCLWWANHLLQMHAISVSSGSNMSCPDHMPGHV